MQPTGVALVILAAGGSQRMGQPRQSLPSRERSLIRHAVETGVASMCRPIVVVIATHVEGVSHELHSLPVMIAYNHKWASGIGSSLRVAMEALATYDVEGTVIMVLEPLVTAEVLNRIVEAHYMTGKDIVASEYEDACEEPLYMGRRFFDEIASLDGCHGPRHIVDRHLEDVMTVPLADAVVDVDTPRACERLTALARLSRR